MSFSASNNNTLLHMRYKLNTLFASIIALLCTTSTAQDNASALIPMPNSITECSKEKTFEINEKTAVCSALPQGAFIIDELKQIISNRTGVRVTEHAYRKNNRLELTIDSTINGKEHYIFEVDKRGCGVIFQRQR